MDQINGQQQQQQEPQPQQQQQQQINSNTTLSQQAASIASNVTSNVTSNVPSNISCAISTDQSTGIPQQTNVVTIPVPIVHNEEYYTYITIKGSLHDHSCNIFGLNEAETQALTKRFANSFKPTLNGIMIREAPMSMVNVMAQLGYKVVSSCGEAEICWTMQREV